MASPAPSCLDRVVDGFKVALRKARKGCEVYDKTGRLLGLSQLRETGSVLCIGCFTLHGERGYESHAVDCDGLQIMHGATDFTIEKGTWKKLLPSKIKGKTKPPFGIYPVALNPDELERLKDLVEQGKLRKEARLFCLACNSQRRSRSLTCNCEEGKRDEVSIMVFAWVGVRLGKSHAPIWILDCVQSAVVCSAFMNKMSTGTNEPGDAIQTEFPQTSTIATHHELQFSVAQADPRVAFPATPPPPPPPLYSVQQPDVALASYGSSGFSPTFHGGFHAICVPHTIPLSTWASAPLAVDSISPVSSTPHNFPRSFGHGSFASPAVNMAGGGQMTAGGHMMANHTTANEHSPSLLWSASSIPFPSPWTPASCSPPSQRFGIVKDGALYLADGKVWDCPVGDRTFYTPRPLGDEQVAPMVSFLKNNGLRTSGSKSRGWEDAISTEFFLYDRTAAELRDFYNRARAAFYETDPRDEHATQTIRRVAYAYATSFNCHLHRMSSFVGARVASSAQDPKNIKEYNGQFNTLVPSSLKKYAANLVDIFMFMMRSPDNALFREKLKEAYLKDMVDLELESSESSARENENLTKKYPTLTGWIHWFMYEFVQQKDLKKASLFMLALGATCLVVKKSDSISSSNSREGSRSDSQEQEEEEEEEEEDVDDEFEVRSTDAHAVYVAESAPPDATVGLMCLNYMQDVLSHARWGVLLVALANYVADEARKHAMERESKNYPERAFVVPDSVFSNALSAFEQSVVLASINKAICKVQNSRPIVATRSGVAQVYTPDPKADVKLSINSACVGARDLVEARGGLAARLFQHLEEMLKIRGVEHTEHNELLCSLMEDLRRTTRGEKDEGFSFGPAPSKACGFAFSGSKWSPLMKLARTASVVALERGPEAARDFTAKFDNAQLLWTAAGFVSSTVVLRPGDWALSLSINGKQGQLYPIRDVAGNPVLLYDGLPNKTSLYNVHMTGHYPFWLSLAFLTLRIIGSQYVLAVSEREETTTPLSPAERTERGRAYSRTFGALHLLELTGFSGVGDKFEFVKDMKASDWEKVCPPMKHESVAKTVEQMLSVAFGSQPIKLAWWRKILTTYYTDLPNILATLLGSKDFFTTRELQMAEDVLNAFRHLKECSTNTSITTLRGGHSWLTYLLNYAPEGVGNLTQVHLMATLMVGFLDSAMNKCTTCFDSPSIDACPTGSRFSLPRAIGIPEDVTGDDVLNHERVEVLLMPMLKELLVRFSGNAAATDFRGPEQREAVLRCCLLPDDNVIELVPGAGKSMSFFLPMAAIWSFCEESNLPPQQCPLSLVLVPNVALALDIVDKSNAANLPALRFAADEDFIKSPLTSNRKVALVVGVLDAALAPRSPFWSFVDRLSAAGRLIRVYIDEVDSIVLNLWRDTFSLRAHILNGLQCPITIMTGTSMSPCAAIVKQWLRFLPNAACIRRGFEPDPRRKYFFYRVRFAIDVEKLVRFFFDAYVAYEPKLRGANLETFNCVIVVETKKQAEESCKRFRERYGDRVLGPFTAETNDEDKSAMLSRMKLAAGSILIGTTSVERGVDVSYVQLVLYGPRVHGLGPLLQIGGRGGRTAIPGALPCLVLAFDGGRGAQDHEERKLLDQMKHVPAEYRAALLQIQGKRSVLNLVDAVVGNKCVQSGLFGLANVTEPVADFSTIQGGPRCSEEDVAKGLGCNVCRVGGRHRVQDMEVAKLSDIVKRMSLFGTPRDDVSGEDSDLSMGTREDVDAGCDYYADHDISGVDSFSTTVAGRIVESERDKRRKKSIVKGRTLEDELKVAPSPELQEALSAKLRPRGFARPSPKPVRNALDVCLNAPSASYNEPKRVKHSGDINTTNAMPNPKHLTRNGHASQEAGQSWSEEKTRWEMVWKMVESCRKSKCMCCKNSLEAGNPCFPNNCLKVLQLCPKFGSFTNGLATCFFCGEAGVDHKFDATLGVKDPSCAHVVRPKCGCKPKCTAKKDTKKRCDAWWPLDICVMCLLPSRMCTGGTYCTNVHSGARGILFCIFYDEKLRSDFTATLHREHQTRMEDFAKFKDFFDWCAYEYCASMTEPLIVYPLSFWALHVLKLGDAVSGEA